MTKEDRTFKKTLWGWSLSKLPKKEEKTNCFTKAKGETWKDLKEDLQKKVSVPMYILLICALAGILFGAFAAPKAPGETVYKDTKTIQLCGEEDVVDKEVNIGDFFDIVTKFKMSANTWFVMIIAALLFLR